MNSTTSWLALWRNAVHWKVAPALLRPGPVTHDQPPAAHSTPLVAILKVFAVKCTARNYFSFAPEKRYFCKTT
jgi:hypothetical protein